MSDETVRDFTKLSPLGRQILQVLALCETRISQATLLHLLKACDWAAAPTKSGFLTQALMKPDLKALIDLDLVDARSSPISTVEIKQPCLDLVVQQSVLNGHFPLISSTVETHGGELDDDMRRAQMSDRPARAARRQARIAFYRGDLAGFQSARQELSKASPALNDLGLLSPFNLELYERTPAELRAEILVREATQAIVTGVGSTEAIEAFDAYVHWHDALSGEIGDWWVNLLAACGDLDGLRDVANAKTSSSLIARGCLEFLTGQHDPAEAAFAEVTSRLRKDAGKRAVVLPALPGLMHILLILRKNDATSRGTLKSLCAAAGTLWPVQLTPIPELITAAVSYADSPSGSTKAVFIKARSAKVKNSVPLVQAIAAHLIHWFLPQEPVTSVGTLLNAATSYEALSFEWLTALCEDGQAAMLRDESDALHGQRHARLGTHPMLIWIQQAALWKRKLESLR